MTERQRISCCFGTASLLASVPLSLLLKGPLGPNLFGEYVWLAMPILAIPASYAASLLMSQSSRGPVFGFWRGAASGYIALVICTAAANPAWLPLTLLVVGWFVILLGGIVGWGINRWMRPNNSFKPNPLRGSA